jgi:membrane protease YdiL (CAAX protease family)
MATRTVSMGTKQKIILGAIAGAVLIGGIASIATAGLLATLGYAANSAIYAACIVIYGLTGAFFPKLIFRGDRKPIPGNGKTVAVFAAAGIFLGARTASKIVEKIPEPTKTSQTISAPSLQSSLVALASHKTRSI